jgi:hypothetical protein
VGDGVPGPNLVVCVGDDRHMPAMLLKDDAFDAGYAEAATNRLMCEAIHRSAVGRHYPREKPA